MNPFLAWLAKRLFGVTAPAAGELLDDAAQVASDYLTKLQDGAPPVPLPYAAVRHQQAQIASATAKRSAYPPTCPESLPPSAPPEPPGPPPGPPVPVPPWHQASVHYPVDDPMEDYPPVSLPLTPQPLPPRPRPLSRTSSGPPPRMSPPPPRPPPPRPGHPRPPPPARKR